MEQDKWVMGDMADATCDMMTVGMCESNEQGMREWDPAGRNGRVCGGIPIHMVGREWGMIDIRKAQLKSVNQNQKNQARPVTRKSNRKRQG